MDALTPRPGRSARPSGPSRSKRCDHLLTNVVDTHIVEGVGGGGKHRMGGGVHSIAYLDLVALLVHLAAVHPRIVPVLALRAPGAYIGCRPGPKPTRRAPMETVPMLTPEMTMLIRENTLALVATVTPEGAPAVSPKGTVVVLDPVRLVFSDLRSPGTKRNLAANPACELAFVDVFRRKAVRVCGRGSYHVRGAPEFDALLPRFTEWPDLQPCMRGIFDITITAAEMVVSPAYDLGADEAELAAQWLTRYRKLIEG